jgi:DNA-binding transcriptional LysR family regulator
LRASSWIELAALRERSRLPAGSLFFTATLYFLPKVVHAFNAIYPKIKFRIVDEGAAKCLASVSRGELERCKQGQLIIASASPAPRRQYLAAAPKSAPPVDATPPAAPAAREA